MGKRDILILLLALALAAMGAAGLYLNSALGTGSWGLSFRQPGQPPVGAVFFAASPLRGINVRGLL